MNRHETFDVWAPQGAPSSPWVKPVLFAHMHHTRADQLSIPTFDTSWVPPPDGRTTVIVDLPGAQGVWLGLALAHNGYRPVPLYNAVPGSGAMVVVQPIVKALSESTELLAHLRLPKDAPPAFLLDANRRMGQRAPAPGVFDNRSISFPTDFPGANLLMNRGVRRAVLVQLVNPAPQPDLAHTLRRWQEAGIVIESKLPDGGPPRPCVVAKPAWYRSIFHRLISLSGLRRNPLGGFGGVIPERSSGG